MNEMTFESWWASDGRFIDPDIDDVPWFDKRKELCAIAWLAAQKAALSALSVKFGHTEILCPPHGKTAARLADFPNTYGCPQCAVNRICELEELIAEMYSHLPGAARLRFNDSEAGRIFERANMAENVMG